MIAQLDVFDEIAEFMASMDPAKVIAFKASKTRQERLDFLLDKQKETGLPENERLELEYYIIINRIINLAKVRAMTLMAL
jgi:hypothetical protein